MAEMWLSIAYCIFKELHLQYSWQNLQNQWYSCQVFEMISYWTGPQIAQIVGISYDTLDYWVKNGLIAPSIVVSHSIKQSRYYFSFSNLIEVAAIKALRGRGISLRKIKKAQAEFSERIGISFEQGLKGGVIVADGRDILTVLYTFDDAVQIMSLLKGGQMILPLDNIVNEITKRAEGMFGEASSRIPSDILLEEGGAR